LVFIILFSLGNGKALIVAHQKKAGDYLDMNKAAKVIGAVGLVALLNSPAKMASQQVVFQPYVIEQDITDKMSEKEKNYFALSQAFNDADLVFKGRCTDVSTGFCSPVGDLCTSYVFESEMYYKLHGSIRKYPLKDMVSLFYDIPFNIGSTTRSERNIMNGGSNGDLYEPTGTGIMPGDELIIFAKKRDLTHNELFIRYYCLATKKNIQALDDILSRQAKK